MLKTPQEYLDSLTGETHGNLNRLGYGCRRFTDEQPSEEIKQAVKARLVKEGRQIKNHCI